MKTVQVRVWRDKPDPFLRRALMSEFRDNNGTVFFEIYGMKGDLVGQLKIPGKDPIDFGKCKFIAGANIQLFWMGKKGD
jgi:hypothetical protein